MAVNLTARLENFAVLFNFTAFVRAAPLSVPEGVRLVSQLVTSKVFWPPFQPFLTSTG